MYIGIIYRYSNHAHCSVRTRDLVDQYEQQRQHFMAGTTVNQFKKLFPASTTHSNLSAGKVPLKLKLKNFWGDETLDDLTKLVSLFGVSGQYLHLSKVDDGCIAALWLCSLYDAKELKINVFEAANSLQAKGVMQVFIGKDFLLECSHSKPGVIYFVF